IGVAEAPAESMEIAESRLPRFVEIRKRQKMPNLAVRERVRSFQEVDLGYQEQDAVSEARRCLTCDVCGECLFDRAQVCCETGSRLL
ncbi:MAG: hypothetical protein Q8P59_09575, partial [Dehalococcoidia bacterium]|nr:hypothetical protein [Dehalococcoidia bacterium]